jgi:hypothetical protein
MANACTHVQLVMNTQDIHSTFANRILQIIEIKIKWLQSQHTLFKLPLFLVLDYTCFMKLMCK